MATKTARRRAARDVKYLLGLYLYTLEKWYADVHNDPAEVEVNKRGYLITARDRLNQLLEMEDSHHE